MQIRYQIATALLFLQATAWAAPMPGVCLYGTPKYPAGFSHFDYVNPDAPKGGELREGVVGSFNSLNPFILKGLAPAGIGLTYDTLMKQSEDEAFCLYGLVAESIDIDQNRVTFKINPRARFNDRSAVSAEDIVFSFEILKSKGIPAYRYYYADVVRVSAPDDKTVMFELNPDNENKELPLILGELPVLSKAYWSDKDFTATTLTPPVSGGPYKIADMEVGRFIKYERDPNYWAADLNVNRGFYNFDTIRYAYFRDSTVAAEAFKAGEFDIRQENEAKKWVVFQNDKNVLNGRMIRKTFVHQLPSGMQGFVFNTRRSIFAHPKTREALAYAFDFEFVNRFLFYNLYKRTNSYFDNSFLKAPDQMTSGERRLLEPFRAALPDEIWHQPYQAPVNTGNIRRNLIKALALLRQAGWEVQDGVLKNANGEPFQFEILLDAGSAPTWERVVLPFIGQLKRLGIQASLRVVDSNQYKTRLDHFDYDMIVSVWGQSLSPGNEQRYFWGSESADAKGSYNYAGVKNKTVDYLIEQIIRANTKQQHTDAVHALDRVLLFQYYVIPHWYTDATRMLYWDKFEMPEVVPMKGVNPMTWWYKNQMD